MVKNKQAFMAKMWIDQLRDSVEWDAALWLEYGRILEVSRGSTGRADYSGIEHCYMKAVELSRRGSPANPRSHFNAIHRYAIFLIRHFGDFKRVSDMPSIEDLLREAQVLAENTKQSMEAVFSAKGEVFEKRGDYGTALEEYRKAVSWCETRGLSNSRPYNRIANFILENATELSELTDLAEAEKWLVVIVKRTDLSRYSKIQSYNILGRLVGGTVRESKAAYPYLFNGMRRPDYDEALKYLEEAFESDPETRFNAELKTWQDVRNHVDVKNVLVNKTQTLAAHEEKCKCLRKAQKHFRAAFERLPRENLNDREVQEHVVRALDAYAYFLWNRLGREGCLGKRESKDQANHYYLEAQTLMVKLGLDSKSFEGADEIREHYRIFRENV
jgi:tetratricopeptide (TPR) repeat protein